MIGPLDYLTGRQATAYLQYTEDCGRAMEDGTHYWQRIANARPTLLPVASDLVGVWEDPLQPEKRMRVTHPAPFCIAELMRGGIHPPLDAHFSAQVLIVSKDGRHAVADRIDAPRVRADLAPIAHEITVDYRRCHAETAPPMTLEQATEYILAKDIPAHVWQPQRNRRAFAIVRKTSLPQTRTFRSAWRMADIISDRIAA